MKKILNRNLINIIIKYMFIIIFSVIFLVLIFVDTNIQYSYINQDKLDNLMCIEIILFISLIIFIIVKLINTRFNLYKLISKNEKLIIRSIFILLFIFQIIIISSIYFQPGFDPEMLFDTAQGYAETGIFERNIYFSNNPYFDVYPNNLFLASIFGIIIKIAMLFNCSDTYKVLQIISIILVDISGIIMVKIIGGFSKKRIFKILGAFLFAILIGMSPWFFIPYSDTFSIIFPISILYNYTKNRKNFYNYLLIGLFAGLGYLIKPTNIIVLIAISILELYKLLFVKRKNIRNFLKNIFLVIIGIIIVIVLNVCVGKIVNYEIDKKYSLSAYHYLMMGINKETTGTFSIKDLRNSLENSSYDDRIEYNKKVFFNRLQEMSVKDFIEFYIKKILTNYNDGLFSWGDDKHYSDAFYIWEVDIVAYNFVDGNFLSNLLREIFYHGGELYYNLASVMQIIWIFIIMSTMIGAILNRAKYKNSVIYLTIIGLTIFLLIFEARARYLYLYLPYYIISAIIGLDMLYQKLKNKSI